MTKWYSNSINRWVDHRCSVKDEVSHPGRVWMILLIQQTDGHNIVPFHSIANGARLRSSLQHCTIPTMALAWQSSNFHETKEERMQWGLAHMLDQLAGTEKLLGMVNRRGIEVIWSSLPWSLWPQHHKDNASSIIGASSQTSRSSENNCFPYVFYQLVVSCEFRSICFAKFVRQIWTSSLHDTFT